MPKRTHSANRRALACVYAATAAYVIGGVLVGAVPGCRKEPEEGGEAAAPARAGQSTPFPEEREVDANAFTSARVCGACHQAIHACWQQSLHAQAYNNGIFQAAYRTASQARSEERTRLCLLCHAPVVRLTRDYAAQGTMIQEGVTCDFCHSVRAVRVYTPEVQVDLNVGRTKYGPLRHAQSPAHEIVESEVHGRSEFCAVCHEYRNEYGVAVLETYSEWKAGAYAAEGRQCQDCHMPVVSEQVSALGRKQSVPKGVNLHNISGSHNLEQVRKAVALKIVGVAWLPGNTVNVELLVSNVGSGHCFPTGIPMHRAVLEVTVTDRQRHVGQRTIAFEKQLLNKDGLPVTREYEAFLDARATGTDTRLKPKEDRRVVLAFHDVEASDGLVEASLWYQYSTQCVVRKEGVETIEPVEMKFLLALQKHRLSLPGE
jgi:hypothetical protein